MSSYVIPKRRPMVKLRRFIQEHSPRITQQDLALVANVNQSFIGQIIAGYRPMPVAVRKSLIKYGIPESVLPKPS